MRPDISFRVSKLQTVAGKGHIKDMREANKVLEFALNSSEQGVHFASTGIDWDDVEWEAWDDVEEGIRF